MPIKTATEVPKTFTLLIQRNNPYQPQSVDAKVAKIADFLKQKDPVGYLLDPMRIPGYIRDMIHRELTRLYGTPARPRVAAESGVSQAMLEELKVDATTLAEGSRNYRKHCLHCHGVPGDGRGPTAIWVNPHPRDFRAGTYKFHGNVSKGVAKPPHRDDLLRTLKAGIEGTAMPSFVLLSEAELESMVSYVMHLSIRGSVEFQMMKESLKFVGTDSDTGMYMPAPEEGTEQAKPMTPGEPGFAEHKAAMAKLVEAALDDAHKGVVEEWVASQSPSARVVIPKYPYSENWDDPKAFDDMKQSVQRGYKSFLDPKGANCKQCHDDYGRRAKFKWDAWGTLVRPNNLTNGVYRGGKRPVDLYLRLYNGIAGSGMNHFSDAPFDDGMRWDLVNFIRVLPYPGMRKKFGITID
jgi:mono/diheme cytochrome c family protein